MKKIYVVLDCCDYVYNYYYGGLLSHFFASCHAKYVCRKHSIDTRVDLIDMDQLIFALYNRS